MPLSFDRWSSERRKKDEKERKDVGKKDKKRKKPKTKEEELLEAEIEELKCQLVDERQCTRREKLNSARLQKELSDCQTKLAMKETLAQALVQEQEQRRRAEERLGNVLADNETYKAQLVHLKRNSSVTEKADKEKQEKLQNGSVMNSAGPNNNGDVEPRILDEESIVQALQKEKALLLERLRVLESGNSALVLEGEKQQEVYERCLDEVASQVVQALLIQRELKEECTKLRNRVEELEIQNRQLRHLFEQEVWSQKQIQDTCFTENGSSITHQFIPDNAGISPISTGALNHQRSMSAVYKHTFFSQTEMHHLSHHLLTSHLNGNKDPRIPDQSSGSFHRQASLPNSYFSSSLPPGHPRHNPFCKNLPSSSAINGYEGFAGGGECLGSSDVVCDLGNLDSTCLNPSGNQYPSTYGVTNIARKTQSLPTTPLTQRSAAYRSHLDNQTTFEFTENQNHLSDKYTKPFVHAPLDYAQSLLQELQEIGASMKTFETLTLEPRANPSQKRKVFGELEQTPQPQKLVKGHGFDYLRNNCSSSMAENADTFSLEDFPPESTSSIASGESIETAYERIIPSPEKSPQKNNLPPFPVSKIGGTHQLAERKGDALFEIDEKSQENEQKSGGQLWSSCSAFSRPMKNYQQDSKCEENVDKKSSETKVPDVNRTERSECPSVNNSQELTDKKVFVNCNLEDLQRKTVPKEVENSVQTKRPLIPTTEIEITVDKLKDEGENLDLKDIDEGVYEKEIYCSPQWEELRDDEEQPPSLPPRCKLIDRSFDSISDDVFLGDGDSSQLCSMDGDRREAGEDEREGGREDVPPERPPKPLWMRMGNINLSPSASDEAVSPPPLPERRPIQPEGQECHSWQWTEDFGTSSCHVMDDKMLKQQSHGTDTSTGAVSAQLEKVQQMSTDSDPDGDSMEYLAMWKAREKPPSSWEIPFNQDDIKTTTHSAVNHNESRIPNLARSSGTREGDAASNLGDRVTATSASSPQVGNVVSRGSSGKVLQDDKADKLVQKKKSSIPLFKSKKDASRKAPNSKDKSVVKDIVSSIKAVMDSKGGDRIKGGNPLRRSLRSKSQKVDKNEDKKVVGNGHCNKGVGQVKVPETNVTLSKKDKTTSKLPRVISKQPQVPNKLDSSGKGKPLIASPKQQSVTKNIDTTPKASFNQMRPLRSELSSKSASVGCNSSNFPIVNGKQRVPVEKDKENDHRVETQRAAKEKTTAPVGENNLEIANDKLAPQNLKWQIDLKSSKGSLNLDLSESEFSKSRRSSVESLGSIGSFTVEGVPFIDDPGDSPDPATSRQIQELSEKFSELSSTGVNQGGASPDDVTLLREHKMLGHASDLNISGETSDKLADGCASGSSVSVKQKYSAFTVDPKEIDDIKKGKLVRDYDPVSYNLNILANRSAFTLPTMGKNYSDPQLNRSKIKSLSRGHSPPERQGKMTQSDSDLQGAPKYPLPSSHPPREEKVIHVPLVNGEEIFDGCDEVAMDENASLENGGEHEAQLSEKERATLLDSLFETDSDEEADDGSCSQDASELTSSDSHPDEKEFLRLMEEKGDAKRQVVRPVSTHNRVSLMHLDICSMFNRYGDKERQALSSFDFLEKVLSQELDGEQPYLDELRNGTKAADTQCQLSLPKFKELQHPLQLSDINRSYPEDTQGGDGQVSPFQINNEVSNTSMSSSLSTGSLSS